MRKIQSSLLVILLFLLVIPNGQSVDACTTFCLKAGNQLVFGRNYDWSIGAGFVVVNKRNLSKTAFIAPPDKPATWVSKYGSITFNQYGKEYPMGGINEAGLVVEQMMLQVSQFPDSDARPAIGELPWIQYQLDNFSSVEEVIASNSSIRILKNSVPIHFLACDKSGRVATIEFLEGKMVYHTSQTLPIEALANSTYDESLEYLENHAGFGGEKEISHSTRSLDRFVRAASMIHGYKNNKRVPIIDYAFEVLADVSQQNSTQWSIVYDIKNFSVYFKTLSAQKIKILHLRDFDFSCQTPSKVIDIDTDRPGNISRYFLEFSTDINKKLIYDAFKNTEFLKDTPNEFLDQLSKYPETIKCKEKKTGNQPVED